MGYEDMRYEDEEYEGVEYEGVEYEKATSAPATTGYEKNFTTDGFWDKVMEYALTVGCKGIKLALQLFYALDNPNMPARIKAVIWGALGYFICPVDAIPDVVPIVGYSDDILALTVAVAVAAAYIDANAKSKADEKLMDWFGGGC